jgi:hypothetical protein
MAISKKNLAWTAKTEQDWITLSYGSQRGKRIISGNGDTRGIDDHVEKASEGDDTIGYIRFYCEAGEKYNKEIIVSRAICECTCNNFYIEEI